MSYPLHRSPLLTHITAHINHFLPRRVYIVITENVTFGLMKHRGDFIEVGVKERTLKRREEMDERPQRGSKPQSTETFNDNMECVVVYESTYYVVEANFAHATMLVVTK